MAFLLVMDEWTLICVNTDIITHLHAILLTPTPWAFSEHPSSLAVLNQVLGGVDIPNANRRENTDDLN